VVSFAGCASNQSNNPESGADESSPAAVVKEYYTAVAAGDLEDAAANLAVTQSEGAESVSVEQMVSELRERGLGTEGVDVTLGQFNELSLSEFAEFTFEDEDGEQRQFTEQQVSELAPTAAGFGGDEQQVSLVHHTGGFRPGIWVPYQPTEVPADGWGEVIVEVGSFGGELFVIGDFRTYTDFKVIDS
jgi:hypothetical protein